MVNRKRPMGSGNRPMRVFLAIAVLLVVAAGIYMTQSLFGGSDSPGNGPDTVAEGNEGKGNKGNGGETAEPVEEWDGEEEATAAQLSQVYDIVISNGRVINPENNLDKEGMNIGITGNTIGVVTSESLQGERVIDATGLVVTPGFIDNLSYDPNPLGVWNKIADGVTTNNAMHGGTTTHNSWYAHYERDRPPVHFGASYFYTQARNQFKLGRYEAAKPEHTAEMLKQAEEALNNGSLALSFSFEYVPGITVEEVMPFMHLAHEYNVPVFFHGRYSSMEGGDGDNFDTMREIINYGRESGAAVHIDHINSTGGTFSMPESLAMIDEALAEGIDVTACIYPYNFWGTYLNSARFDEGWQERFRISYNDLQIAGTSERLTEQTFRQYQKEGKLAVAYAIPEEDVVLSFQHPSVMIGSDAILEPGHNNHPRASGTFARSVGKYVREDQIMDLPEMIAKLTLMPAQRLEKQSPSLQKKGRLAAGMDADIVIFDFDTIIDRSTVEQPELESAGIEYVLVEGELALENGEVNRSTRLGKPLRSEFVRFSETVGSVVWEDASYPVVNYRDRNYIDLDALKAHGYDTAWDKVARTFTITEGEAAAGSAGDPGSAPENNQLMLERGYMAVFGELEAELISIGERAYMPIQFLQELGYTLTDEGDAWTVE
ncbi:amidohydrolase family protein [Paenibacillus daejeonensis]|uniref:amidohydrolase family protein n=1 Tax=Paenibacillus daejeonensis TaxID=135193 RepID=UPI0003A7BF22|nr:amidohydrolase family protein [Paenibacillus daejeonensis]